MTQGSLQAALPREMYVDGQSWLAERETVLFGQWYCIGRLDDLGLTASSRVVVVDVVGSPCSSRAPQTESCTVPTTSAGTAGHSSDQSLTSRRPDLLRVQPQH